MKNLIIFLVFNFVLFSCIEDKRFNICDKDFVCLRTNDTIKKKINLEKIKTVFLINKYKFLKQNNDYIYFEHFYNYIEIYNFNNKKKYNIDIKYNFENIDTNKLIIKKYLNRLSYEYTIKNLIKIDDTLVFIRIRLPSSFPKSSPPPPLPPDPINNKESLYNLEHNLDM